MRLSIATKRRGSNEDFSDFAEDTPVHSKYRGAAQLTRPDNTCAYRAAVNHTPGTPRLLWVENVDDTAEFAWSDITRIQSRARGA